jgi:uncharacterized membrane protein YdbT with pleckstrin-like domain
MYTVVIFVNMVAWVILYVINIKKTIYNIQHHFFL